MSNNPLIYIDPTGLQLGILSGDDLAMMDAYGGGYNNSPPQDDNGIVQWEHNALYLVQSDPISRSIFGQIYRAFSGEKEKTIVGRLIIPTDEQCHELGISALDFPVIVVDHDGEPIDNPDIYDQMKGDYNFEAGNAAFHVIKDVILDVTSISKIGQGVSQGAKGLTKVADELIPKSLDAVDAGLEENIGDAAVELIPGVSTWNSWNGFVEKVYNRDGINQRDIFYMLKALDVAKQQEEIESVEEVYIGY